ncbi:aspartate aminotransferase family protein [Actinoallomurus purpureus]|uniref:aspartate aminotransferase family protein n=1 Tax=Actinoallomurus purpureus TaxID=478114 RepID=UPI002092B5D8|nr:aspartate aminotransferase family protein [Actinoallomurus purpureus]MCO6009886.1 aspartate aminotransferase family protein [Actinoallomurus purpureus]
MAHLAEDAARHVLDRYVSRTPTSSKLHEEAKKWLPGGDTRTINHFSPYPVFMSHGAGCVLTDVDGNEYLDFCNNMSAIVHGHAHPVLVQAAAEQISLGTALGTVAEVQVRHAEAVCRRVPSVESVRYCNSGTEATMMALRAARAFTGRDVIVKIDGGYHGLHDDAEINMFTGMTEPRYPQAGLPESFPLAQPARGVPVGRTRDVLLLPYNDLAAAEELLDRRGQDIAALIVEPMMGAAGCIPGDVDYLRGLRRLTADRGVLLIFDECATFRMGPLQARYGITPDLTSLSKIIGGGLPLGAFGGRADIMAQFDPTRPNPVYHAGAFAGNNLSLAVGLAALDTYGADEVTRLNAMGERLIRDIPVAAREAGVMMQVTGVGSLANLHWGDGPIRSPQDVAARAAGLGDLPELLHLELMNRGVYVSRRGLFALSTPMTDEHLDTFVTAVRDALTQLRPHVAEQAPHLLHEAPAASGTGSLR